MLQNFLKTLNIAKKGQNFIQFQDFSSLNQNTILQLKTVINW